MTVLSAGDSAWATADAASLRAASAVRGVASEAPTAGVLHSYRWTVTEPVETMSRRFGYRFRI